MEWTSVFETFASEYTQGDTWTLQSNNSIEPDNQSSGWKQYIRNTVGRFKCSKCGRTWPSNRVMVVFHMHLDTSTRQGTIKVRRFRQNCKQCSDAPMETPDIQPENVEILMENLVKNIRKKFYDEKFDYQPRRHVGVEVKNPHEPSHCEACIKGVCNRDAENVPKVADRVADLLKVLNLEF